MVFISLMFFIPIRTRQRVICCPEVLAEVLRQALRAEGERGGVRKERFLAIGLDTGNVIKYIDFVTLGGAEPGMFHPRETFRAAVMKGAVKVITAHSYLSGPGRGPKFSKNDMGIVKELVRAGEVLGISMIDHLIITDTGYKSLCGSKYIN